MDFKELVPLKEQTKNVKTFYDLMIEFDEF
jgi:hypothetical protein